MTDPLHQFLIQKIIPFNIGKVDLSFTNAALSMVVVILLLVGFMVLAMRNKENLIPSRVLAVFEMLHNLVFDLLINYIGKDGIKYFPFVFSLFLFILTGNVLGLIPHSYTFTSQLVVTFTLAIIVFLLVIIIGFKKNGLKFLGLFLPNGIPIYIAPLLILIEFISFLFRPLSLSIRLFANMVAGHIMLKIFAGFGALLISSKFFPIAILPMLVNTILTGFEMLISCLQAYVFTILTCLYLNDAVNFNKNHH